MNRILSLILAILICLPSPALAFKVHYYDSDATGTPIAIEDEDGNQEWKGEYYPFGEERGAGSAKINNRRLIGKEKDVETGLTYFEARHMFAGSGRFLTPDPVGAVDEFSSATNYVVLVQPQRLNRYAYGLNNPYRYVDPDGQFALVAAALAGAAVAYCSAPDIANAPESSSTQTYASHGARNIALGAAGGLGIRAVSSAVGAYKLAQGASKGGKPGSYVSDRTLPTDKYGVPTPDTDAPHTQLGRSKPKYGSEPQARTWDYGSNGKLQPQNDIDFTDHGYPDAHPDVPHKHTLSPNNPELAPKGGYQRGSGEPL